MEQTHGAGDTDYDEPRWRLTVRFSAEEWLVSDTTVSVEECR